MDLIQNISQAEIAIAIATIPLVTKGITSKFKISNGNHKELIALLVAVGAFVYLLFKDNSMVQTVALFIMLYAGGTGIYNFMPKSIKEEDYGVVEDLEIEDEQLDKEIGN